MVARIDARERPMSLLSKVTPVMPVLERPHGLLEGPRFGPGVALVYAT